MPVSDVIPSVGVHVHVLHELHQGDAVVYVVAMGSDSVMDDDERDGSDHEGLRVGGSSSPFFPRHDSRVPAATYSTANLKCIESEYSFTQPNIFKSTSYTFGCFR